jgi:hypothetical protein
MKRIIIIAAILFGANVQAQMSGQIGQFDLVPQRIYANPAFQPKAKVNIAFPALGNIYVQHGNNWVDPEKYVSSNSVLSPESILSAIEDEAITTQRQAIELIHVGIRFDKNYIHLRASERVEARLSIPADIFRLAVYGNVGAYQFEGNTANFTDLAFDAIHFREYAIGFNRQFTDKLTAGITAKYLYGMEVIQTENSSLKLRTDPNTYELTSSGQFDVNTAGINSLVSDDEDIDIKEYLLQKQNTGFAFDLGGTYRPIEKLELHISAHDIGFIRWKDDVKNYTTDDATFAFDGVDLTDFLFEEDIEFGDEFQNEADSLLDELEETFNFEESEESFSTGLNGYMRYGAAYTLLQSEKSKGTAWANMVHGLGKSMTDFQVSLGYNHLLWNSIQAGVHMTKTKDLPLTFGGGLSLNGGFFQIYAMVENFAVAPLAEVTIIDENDSADETTLFLPASPLDLRVHFGINFTFNRKYGDDRTGGSSML